VAEASPFASETNLSPETVRTTIRRQLEADTQLGLVQRCEPAQLESIIARSVDALWAESRIKIFLPVLALRHARDELQELAP
jgi:hypothetical protein